MHEMTLRYLEKPKGPWTERVIPSKEFPRQWITTCEMTVWLSDNYKLIIPIGTVWDGASIPKWLWWLFKPIDKGAIGDLIHDELWKDKQGQFEYFDFNIHQARKFADDERMKWRTALTLLEIYPDDYWKVKIGKVLNNFKYGLKNEITHGVIRLIGGFFYSRQLEIPQ